MKHNRVLLLIIVVIASCSAGSKVVKYPTRPDDTFANTNLKLFFKSTPAPSIVLKVPNSADKATSNSVNKDDNALLYNAIEKELLKEGFSVRDRGLFNELIQKTNSDDYSKIRDLTNTDLILEVVNIDLNVKYTTNKITETSHGKEHEVVQATEYKSPGVSIQFKVILVKTNEIAGTYNFNYKPCPEGCPLPSFKTVAKRSTEVELKESISSKSDELEDFMKRCTRDLIKSFKNS
jgi:hypothetical protein